MTTCRGLDVSAYQPAQDWPKHKADGVAFAFAKASEGQHSRDALFATHISGIKAAGLVPGAYHFAWPNQDVTTEAANYISAVKPYAGPGFVHWLDLERYSDGRNYNGRSAPQIQVWVARWIAAVQAAFPGQRVGVYTSGDDLAGGHVPAGVPLWYPAYPWSGAVSYGRAESVTPLKPPGWTPLFWQFTSTPIDRSICYLTESGLRAWAAGTTEEDDVSLTTEQAAQLKALHDNLLSITSLTEKDAKGNPAVHGAGYYLAHIHYDALKIAAMETAQTAAITAMATALGKVDAAIDVPALVAQVQEAVTEGVTKALDSITVHVDATAS